MSDPAIQMGLFLFNVYKGPVVGFLASRLSNIKFVSIKAVSVKR